jgi:rhodanese-related sulfurtransferase
MVKTFQDFVADAKTRIQEMSAEDLKAWLDEGKAFTLVDTREESEYAAGRIADAVHVARGVLELKIDGVQPDRNAPIVAYCGGGNRSALVADVMQQMGYTNVYSLAGGWRNWPFEKQGVAATESACKI